MEILSELMQLNWWAYLLIGIVSYWIFLNKRIFYWVNKGIPYDTPLPFLGSTKLLNFSKSDMFRNEYNYYKKYGPLYGHNEGGVPALTVAIPEIVQRIVIKDFQSFQNRPNFPNPDEMNNLMLFGLKDEDWKRVRSIVTPTFTSGKMRKMYGLIGECLKSLTENISDSIKTNKSLEMKRFFGAFTMDVIASTAFATRIDSHKNPDNPFVKNASRFFQTDLSLFFPFIFTFPNVFYVIGSLFPSLNVFKMDFFKNITRQILQDRKDKKSTASETKVDFMQLLIEAQKELGLKDGTAKSSLSEKEMFAQAIQFFIVGYDTTATTISLCSYLIAKHPEIQEKLFQEVDRVLKENNNEVSYDTVHKMEYLDACFSETLRVYPVAPRIDREANEDYTVPIVNVHLKKGMRVQIPVVGMHRDAKNFEKPLEFIPERFLPGSKLHFNPLAYMPFGVGPRMCIAIRFARMEAKMCLATMIHKFHLKVDPKLGENLEFLPGTFLLQPKSVALIVEERKPAQN